MSLKIICGLCLLQVCFRVNGAEEISSSFNADAGISCVFLDWGNPQNINSNGEYEINSRQPDWLVGAKQVGGIWLTNRPTAWYEDCRSGL